jgi:hypothetical protein
MGFVVDKTAMGRFYLSTAKHFTDCSKLKLIFMDHHLGLVR